jgi:ABC-2 type transport system ATP-binding protein
MTDMITIQGLKKRFRHTDALRGVDLKVPAGRVTAFLGPNGSGKTTTIKCAMNLIERDAGDIEVLGADPMKLAPEHWRRIGYVSENQQLPDWMTVPQLLDYVRPMYGEFWDRDFEKKLLAEFELPMQTKLNALSRGQRMKAALLSSLAYRPKLVVLDEPFSGLDALVRDECFADRVAVLNAGRVDLEEDVEALQARFREIEVVFDGDPPEIKPDRHWMNLRVAGRTVRFVDSKYEENRRLSALRERFPAALRVDERPMSLREIFVALARTYRLENRSPAATSVSPSR